MRIRLLIEYDGSEFSGWQLQPDQKTVQGEIENALKIIFKKDIRIHGSGRTDAGVHASGQIAHCDIPETKDLEKLCYSLHSITEKSIAIKKIQKVSDNFHARFDANKRTYKYYISENFLSIKRNYVWQIGRKLDLDYLNKIAHNVIGEHDFTSFSKIGSDVDEYDSVVFDAKWYKESSLIVFEISAIRFLRGMVRGLVGTMIEFEKLKRKEIDFTEIMQKKNRKFAGSNAPATGLILENVSYENK
jgi:tRNA pseudouridine38-40 synthase